MRSTDASTLRHRGDERQRAVVLDRRQETSHLQRMALFAVNTGLRAQIVELLREPRRQRSEHTGPREQRGSTPFSNDQPR